ncbi:MAG: cell division protein FtsZ [Candidatus Hydrogenedens sp.]|jgi:cell division protein FtsZ|nr:cell division protein FtsZ [Candidatus Hydrogenedens sp.]
MAPNNLFQCFEEHAIIKVCGVGGGGGNAVNRMINAQMSGVDFIAINTDAQDLQQSLAPYRLQIGQNNGLGAGAIPEVGRLAAEENREEIHKILEGADLIFLTLGLGGGTGTGAAPVVAQEAASVGALTIAVVTLPFEFEGADRMNNALEGLEALEKEVDTLIVVPNDRIAELCDENMALVDAFRHGDEVLHNGVRAISELITEPGLINLDFSDLRTIMESKGRALMGIGIATGENRAMIAAEEAINCPLLEQTNIQGAKGVIINIRGGKDLRMAEVVQANSFIRRNTSPDARIISGNVVDLEDREEIQITVIAAGFPCRDAEEYRTALKREVITPAPVMAAVAESDNTLFPESNDSDAETDGKENSYDLVEGETDDLFRVAEEAPAPPPPVSSKSTWMEDINIPAFLLKQHKDRHRQ